MLRKRVLAILLSVSMFANFTDIATVLADNTNGTEEQLDEVTEVEYVPDVELIELDSLDTSEEELLSQVVDVEENKVYERSICSMYRNLSGTIKEVYEVIPEDIPENDEAIELLSNLPQEKTEASFETLCSAEEEVEELLDETLQDKLEDESFTVATAFTLEDGRDIVTVTEFSVAYTSEQMVLAEQTAWDIIQNYCDVSKFLYDPQNVELSDANKAELKSLADNLVSGCSSQMQKIEKIYDWVADNIYYDYYYLDNQTTVSTYYNSYLVYKNKRTVCEGYANLYETLCILEGIPCMYLIGDNHKYNAVYDADNSRWLFVDTTWGSSNRYYRNSSGEEIWSKGITSRLFLDLQPANIASFTNHEIMTIDYLLPNQESSAYYTLSPEYGVGWWDYNFSYWADMDWDMALTSLRDDSCTSVVSESKVAGFDVNNVELRSATNLESIDLSKAVAIEEIPACSFYHCGSLSELILPENLKKIGKYAFYYCDSLTKFTLPSSVKSIEDDAFYTYKNIDTIVRTSLDESVLRANDSNVWGNRKVIVSSYDYKINFNGNGSTSGTMPAQLAMENVPYKLPDSSYKKSGYSFVGWSLTPSATGTCYIPEEEVTNLAPKSTKEVTLYAQWDNEFYSINFDGNSCDGGSCESLTNVGKNTYYQLPKTGFYKAGYEIAAWNTKADGSGINYPINAAIKGIAKAGQTVTLYAVWQLSTYTITYDMDGGVNNPNNKTSYTCNDKTFVIDIPTKEGYYFNGWKLRREYIRNGKVEGYYSLDGRTVSIYNGSTGNITATAKWSLPEYTVSFDGNGATSGSMEECQAGAIGTEYEIPFNEYKKKGYVFVEWNTKSDGSGRSYSQGETSWDLASSKGQKVTLYAIWRAASYHVSYDFWPVYMIDENNSLSSYYSESFTYEGTSRSLFKPAKIYGDYELVGWSRDDSYSNLEDEFDFEQSEYAYYNAAYKYKGTQIMMRGTSLSMADGIIFHAYFATNYADAKVTFVHPDGKSETVEASKSPTKYAAGIESYDFACKINPAQLTEVLEVNYTFMDRNMNSLTTYTYSFVPSDSATSIVEGQSWYDSETVEAAKAILNYCGYAQKYFNYNTEKLANSVMTDAKEEINKVSVSDLNAYKSSITGTAVGLNYIGSSLVLLNSTSIRHYFTVSSGHSISEYKFMQGSKVLTPKANGGVYYIEISAINPGELSNMYKVTVGGMTISYSAYSYAYAVLNSSNTSQQLKDLMKAMYKIGTVALN